MTAAESSVLGFAKQTAKGTPNTTDSDFTYVLFNQGVASPQNIILPLDQEVGGGAMLRDVTKVGVMSQGALDFIPRPNSLGMFLFAILGEDTSTPGSGASYSHALELPTDQFDAPYYTVRSAPAYLHGEQHQDARVNSLALTFRGSNFLRGSLGYVGGLPAKVATTTWAPSTYLDSGPQILSPIATIQVPDGTDIAVISGSFVAGAVIPLDEQWVVGSYSPDAFDINQKAFAFQFNVKISDSALYSKVTYDPAAGNAWVADMLKEADIVFTMASNVEAEAGVPHSITIEANGDTQASGTANIAWSATPLGLRAGRQVVMSLTGTFLADSTGAPITVTVVNTEAAY